MGRDRGALVRLTHVPCTPTQGLIATLGGARVLYEMPRDWDELLVQGEVVGMSANEQQALASAVNAMQEEVLHEKGLT